MAGSIITMPANGAADWSAFTTMAVASWKSYMFVSLTNSTGTAASAVQDGSYIVCNGSMYKMTPDGNTESMTDSGISIPNTIYFYFIPSSKTCIRSTTVPVWSETKGGYYDGDSRCFGGCYLNNAGEFVNKWIMSAFNEGGKSSQLSCRGGYNNYFLDTADASILTSVTSSRTGTGTNTSYSVFYLHRPIMAYTRCYFTTRTEVGVAYNGIEIYQNGGYKKVFGVDSTGTWTYKTVDASAAGATENLYTLNLNPGLYRLAATVTVASGSGINTSANNLYITGVYGQPAFNVSEIADI